MPEAIDTAGAGTVTPEAARALAEEILSRPEYARFRRDPTWLQQWVDGVADWLRAAWETVSGWVPESVAEGWWALWNGLWEAVGGLLGSDGLTALMRLLLAAAVFVAIGVVVRRVLREVRDRRIDASDAPGLVVEKGPDLLAEAERCAAEGRFLEAAHCTQLAALQLLLRKKCIELERSDPNRVLRRRLADASLPAALRDAFLSGIDRLEGQWFRDRREDEGLYGQWRRLHAQVQALPEAR
jgi:hypothetical protein